MDKEVLGGPKMGLNLVFFQIGLKITKKLRKSGAAKSPDKLLAALAQFWILGRRIFSINPIPIKHEWKKRTRDLPPISAFRLARSG
jgi:hypothetical protein